MANNEADDPQSDDAGKDAPTGRKVGYDLLNGEKSGSRSTFNRRSFLKLTGLAASTLGASGFVETAVATSTFDGITFDEVVNAVDDLGMDPNGNQPIDGALDGALRPGTLIEFPPGEYRIEQRHFLDGLDRFGIRGTGSGPRDVTFSPPSGAWLKAFDSRGGSFGRALFENFSFDHRDDDSTLIAANFRTSGGTMFRDIELLGRGPREMDHASFKFGVQVTDTDGVAFLENFTAGVHTPSVEVPYGEGVICLYGGPSHQGELVLRNPTIHRQNGSPARYTNIGGVLTVEGGEFVNNQNMCFRFCGGSHPTKHSVADGVRITLNRDMIATSEAIRLDASSSGGYGAEFRNCVIEADMDNNRGCITAPSFGEHGSATFRNCTIRNTGSGTPMVNARGFSGNRPSETAIVFEDCNLTGRGDFIAHERPGSVVRNSCVDVDGSYRGDFTTENIGTDGCRQPDGSGGSDDAQDTDLPHVLTVDGNGDHTEYEFTVSGDLEKSTAGGASINDADVVSGNTAEGQVYGGNDSYDFSGEVVQFSLTGSATVYVDGQEVNQNDLGNLRNTLAVSGEGTAAKYEFSVSGDLEPDRNSLEERDSIDGATASGWVTETGEVDLFYFSGEVTDFAFAQGSAAVTLNGQEVDPATLGESDEQSNTLTITGTGTATNYEFGVSGELTAASGEEGLEEWDSLDGATASGWVTESYHVDTFEFTGEITNFAFAQGSAAVTLNGQEVDPATLGESDEQSNTLTITGTGTATNYEFGVSGELTAAGGEEGLEEWDSLDGATASGWVTESYHVDTFEFTGEITDFTFAQGSAAVTLNGQEVDPGTL